ncbi:hypothetical protein S40293_02238 [Stachybotrys chartarum IBT 40293]|nr:hypothetical protein S40293_02238 [Stachybotrys chartarum IBT 40293]KFA71240.1 hypothetical protein S40288_07810 [Stachybotrys chartarum IBT 40288]
MATFTKTYHNTTYAAISPTRPELSYAGKNVLVTGGGSGIGQAISIGFAEAGAKSVTILGRRVERLQQGLAEIKEAAGDTPTELLYEAADIAEPSQLAKAFESVAAKVGKIDVLVSNASAAGTVGKLTDLKPGDLADALRTDVVGALNVFQAFIPVAGPSPIVLNTSSALAYIDPYPNIAIYVAAKAAALRIWQAVAVEHPELRLVHIQPGYIPTAINNYAKDATDSFELPRHFYPWVGSDEAKFLRNKFVWANWDVEELMERADEIAGSQLLTIGLEGAPM